MFFLLIVLLCSWCRIYCCSTKPYWNSMLQSNLLCDTLLLEKFWFPSLLRCSAFIHRVGFFELSSSSVNAFPYLKVMWERVESRWDMQISEVVGICSFLTYSEARSVCNCTQADEVYSNLDFQRLCSSLASWRRECLFGVLWVPYSISKDIQRQKTLGNKMWGVKLPLLLSL